MATETITVSLQRKGVDAWLSVTAPCNSTATYWLDLLSTTEHEGVYSMAQPPTMRLRLECHENVVQFALK